MHDKMICVRRRNISYCWNFETRGIEIFIHKHGTIKDCPPDVAQELLRLMSEEIRAANTECLSIEEMSAEEVASLITAINKAEKK